MTAEQLTPGRLVVLRGNSGSGKSTVAQSLRDAVARPLALVEQDYLRRIVLAEHGGESDPATAGLIAGVVRYALGHGYDVVLEGILDTQRYGAMLQSLHRDYPARTAFYFFSVPFEETVRRQATRPIAGEFDAAEMRNWFMDGDHLGFVEEKIIDAESSVEQTVQRIVDEAPLTAGPR